MRTREVAERLLEFIPAISRNIFKDHCFEDISRQQFELLIKVSINSGKPMSFYSNHLKISKPALTSISDKLIGMELLERGTSNEDRRIVTLSITDKGKYFLEQNKKKIIDSIESKLSVLSQSEINKLQESIDEIFKIVNKIYK